MGSNWALILGGAVGGAVLTACAGAALKIVDLRHERATRWDERLLASYANLLKSSSLALSCALAPERSENQRFWSHYDEAACHYEELVLLNPQVHDAARRMLWAIWNAGKLGYSHPPLLPEAAKRLETIYQDARFHVRDSAHEVIRVRMRAGAIPALQRCVPETHNDPLALGDAPAPASAPMVPPVSESSETGRTECS